VDVLFRPFGKIRLIWGYFETEPDMAFFSGGGVIIGGWIEPGLDGLGRVQDRKNDHIRNVFYAVFAAMASLVLARIAGPEPAQQVIGMITGIRG
jgi:hypothetical protein